MNNDVFDEFDAIVAAHSNNNLISFDFGTCELSETELADASLQEKKFLNSYRKYRNNTFEMCEALSEIEKILKPSGKFMNWYESIGLSKDMVSVLSKRWSLYIEFKEHKDRIFSLSDQAIKILTNKDAEYDDVKAILEGEYSKAKEIKSILLPLVEKNKREFLPSGEKFFNFNKINKMEKRVKSLTDEEKKEYKNELEEYINKLVALKERI
ncbi:MAG: hypothetical protein Q4A58_04035 [Fusobacterium sp.]|uniref:hypothetical protein n=1 Tax=Fusobacterium sp. TaxID=68766 RepID=UPI0026DAABC4|nr:hypothetical protein [Fusobacterium sp.]MDO4690448.1 hypothetical protein [Fusobacterium sp.]